MSVFRKFKLPQLLRKGGSEIGEEIPRFKCGELPIKQRIGQGSFGDVYTTEYRGAGDTKCHTVVVKKMLQVLDQGEKNRGTGLVVFSEFDQGLRFVHNPTKSTKRRPL